ncbi:hypothetical protein C3F09_00030 [candidate division GN15 bacterium]|uniref:PEGA domain-containing protein n=1 Tax=candidate division GN15 bacterium TaxID=2072418 RepID=A0A855XDK8_9BACT|nr:MAG: hypothetical protein C3F09_00030 [candidate division GN15 bacterium]
MLKRILTLAALVLVVTAASTQGADGGFAVNSSPPGAEVTLKGDAVVVGITPTTFQHPLIGEYQVTVKKYGFENYRSRVTLDPAKPLALDIRLTPKTRLKSAVRSLFIPGWGQRYTDQKTKGFFFNLLAAGSVAAFLIADDEFRYRRDLFNQSKQVYDSSAKAGASYTEMQALHTDLAARQKKAYDAETTRRVTIGAVIGVWGWSVLDALFFFPSEHGSYSVGGISVEPSAKPGVLGLQMTRRF